MKVTDVYGNKIDKVRFSTAFATMLANKFIEGKECSAQYVVDMCSSALELNSLTLDTIDFLFGEAGGVEINDGFIMEV